MQFDGNMTNRVGNIPFPPFSVCPRVPAAPFFPPHFFKNLILTTQGIARKKGMRGVCNTPRISFFRRLSSLNLSSYTINRRCSKPLFVTLVI